MLTLPKGEIVIVYEDFSCGLKAKQLFDQLITPWDPSSKHRFKMWDFNGLRIDSLRARAIQEAVAAAIVCVAPLVDTGLPQCVKEWAEKWCDRPVAHRRTLVALMEPADDLFADQSVVIDYLRDIAQRGKAEFLVVRTELFGTKQNTYTQEALNCV
jgi:hypothetical protein